MSLAGTQTRSLSQTQPIALNAVLVLSGALALAVASKLVIPVGPVPITAQTLAVLAIGGAMGSRRGLAAVALFLAAGSAGAPLFAFGGGPLYLVTSPTGGYLLGFLPAAYLMGRLVESGFARGLGRIAAAGILATIAIYALGLLRLSLFGVEDALSVGLYPFIPGELAKIAVASLALWGYGSLNRRSLNE